MNIGSSVNPLLYPITIRIVNDWLEVSQPDLGIVQATRRFNEISSAVEIGQMVLDVMNKTYKAVAKAKLSQEKLPEPTVLRFKRTEDQWVGMVHAARYLGISAATMRRICDSGRLPAMKLAGGHRRILLKDLKQFETEFKTMDEDGNQKLERQKLYQIWYAMRARCINPEHAAYKNYGARGIQVCPEWLNSFDTFCTDMGSRPPGHSIDRINNEGNYEPANCRWATSEVQAQNKRARRKKKKAEDPMLSLFDFVFANEESAHIATQDIA